MYIKFTHQAVILINLLFAETNIGHIGKVCQLNVFMKLQNHKF